MAIKDPQAMLVLPIEAIVNSESTLGKTYHVRIPYCPCRDFQYRRANKPPAEMFCKHLLAAIATVGGYNAPAEQAFDRPGAVTYLVSLGADKRRAASAVSLAECSVRMEAVPVAGGGQAEVSWSDGSWFVYIG